MIKKEWEALGKNKILLLVVLAIILIPIIYAGLFLKSMWDPYGSLAHLPVAVVNEDQPVDYQGQTLHIGQDMVEELKKNDSLDFHFTDGEKAGRGLADGTYYMVITIPGDFSENASTLMDDNPRKMELTYETNPGTNYIASKMSESALTRIRDEVASQVTRTYTQTLFDQIGAAGDGMQDAAAGSKELREGLVTASDGDKTLSDHLETLSKSTLTFRSGADTLTTGLKEYTDGVSQVSEGSQQLKEGLHALTDKAPQLTSGTTELETGIRDYTDGVAQLDSNSEQLLSGSQSLSQGAAALNQGIDSLKSGTGEYVTGANTLADGVTEYVGGVNQLADGIRQLKPLEDLDTVSRGISTLNAALSEGNSSLKAGTQQLEEGLGQLYTQTRSMAESTTAEQVEKLIQGLSAAGKGMAKGGQAMEAASKGMNQAAEGMTTAADTMTQAGSGIQKASQGLKGSGQMVNCLLTDFSSLLTESLTEGNTQIGTALTILTDTADALKTLQAQADENGNISADSLSFIIQSLNASVGTVSLMDSTKYADRSEAIAENASESLKGLTAQLDTLTAGLDQASLGLIQGGNTFQENSSRMEEGAKELKDGADKLNGASAALPSIPPDLLGTMSNAVEKLYEGSKKINQGTDSAADALSALEQGTASFPQAASGVKALGEGFDTLTANNSSLLDGASSLKKAGTSLTDGIDRLATGSRTLAQGADTLKEGQIAYTEGVAALEGNSSRLREGAHQLSRGGQALVTGAAQLSEGIETLSQGTEELVSNNDTLNTGASRLSEGAGQIQEGSSRLHDGSVELGEGLSRLKEGARTLSTGLEDGAAQVNKANAGEGTVDMFAAPVSEKEIFMTTVPNNGHAMAPYMMSVGLWVGCLAFCLMYPLTEYQGKLRSGTAWWAGKATVLYSVAILQGVLLILLLKLFNGFTPAQMGKTIAFACLASVTFTSIMYFFNVTFGKVGSFLMLIFMVIQLSGSAGTYPVEISPSFVSKIHAYLPFTYTVDAFRSTICGGESIEKSVIVLLLLTCIFTVLTILQFNHMAHQKLKGKAVMLDWLEAKGLA